MDQSMTARITAGRGLQLLVDDLSRYLQRSVVVNDRAVRLIYASPHYGDEDQARIQAVLYGDGGSELAGWIRAQGIDEWREPHILPANADFGMQARFCVPLLVSGWTLGHMMIIDVDQSLTSDERELIVRVGNEAAAQLHVDRLASDPEHLKQQQMIRALIDENELIRQEALTHYRNETNAVGASYVAVFMIELTRFSSAPTSLEVALDFALEALDRACNRRSLHLVEGSRAVIIQPSSIETQRTELQRIADGVIVELRRSVGQQCRIDVGIGTHEGGLDSAWLANRRAETALHAVQLRQDSEGGVTTHWTDLGIDSLLLRLPDADRTWDSVPGPVRALYGRDRNGTLIHTLSVFLDHGGSIAETARALHLHRTSLYYRLDQIRKVTRLDLDDGRKRLELHVGLRLLHIVILTRSSDI
ncbi:helix-turn-helix domain-containing protein [Brevibacterium sp.]|uniref:PucR family transcriptional regulator n=1 Tax=Brevibacterium sp. TaxID=1701 RepID=UPI002810EE7C|nr:helix-turn-helix domain-containing protein [Brevibacterium sp.]